MHKFYIHTLTINVTVHVNMISPGTGRPGLGGGCGCPALLLLLPLDGRVAAGPLLGRVKTAQGSSSGAGGGREGLEIKIVFRNQQARFKD